MLAKYLHIIFIKLSFCSIMSFQIRNKVMLDGHDYQTVKHQSITRLFTFEQCKIRLEMHYTKIRDCIKYLGRNVP